MKKIILTGYMGSGKSTIAQLLSQKLGIKRLDLDSVIEKSADKSILEIFETEGEIHFRKLEHQLFNGLMQSDDRFILSLGGGTPCYANNHKLLNGKDTESFYLKASVEKLHGRISADEQKRPLVAGKSKEALLEFIAKHLFERSYYYNQSTYKIETDDMSPEEVVDEIIKRLT